jgi:uncharacterized protein (TIGR00255 family)
MIKSMTAFARAEQIADPLSITIEVKSYNSRYLDVVLRLTHGYQDLEEKIRGLIAEKVARGRVEVKIQIVNVTQESHAFDINLTKAQAYHDVLVELKNRLNLPTDISLDLLANVSGIIIPAETSMDMENCWTVVRKCLNDAMGELVAMRQREGEFIAKDLLRCIDDIEKGLGHIRKSSAGLLNHYQERLKERIAALTRGLVEIDPVRIAQEAAFYADRSDISEETVRAQSHIHQFRKIVNSTEPSGRKLAFLLQEMNREFNTIGSKTENIEVSHGVVEIKGELEKIREQVQNIE